MEGVGVPCRNVVRSYYHAKRMSVFDDLRIRSVISFASAVSPGFSRMYPGVLYMVFGSTVSFNRTKQTNSLVFSPQTNYTD
jgi:hypothetical protein